MDLITKLISLYLVLIFCLITKGQCQSKVFRFEDYGAAKGGVGDNSKALLKAWDDACKWKGSSKLSISSGTYFVKPVLFKGPCNGPIMFKNSGLLKAPLGLKGDNWVQFQYVDRLTISGGGTFDGQGQTKEGPTNRPTLLRLAFATNSKVQNVHLINSQTTHFHLFAVNKTQIKNITISSPANSLNTDGIKIGVSNNIQIVNSTIASGDDCVALIRGSINITMTRVHCGPGHGFSIGSLGSIGSIDNHIEQIYVRNCSLKDTTNGLRIKTWATNVHGIVEKIRYEDILMDNVDNPIIFDQNYCPSKNCAKGNSKVQIRDVKFRNIHGTSKTNVAVNLQCSGSNPCDKIVLKNINIITNNGKGYKKGDTISHCSYAKGLAYGLQVPKPCISFSRYIKSAEGLLRDHL